MIFTYDVYGVPAPQGSKRPVRSAGGRTVLIESSKALPAWRDAVIHCVLASDRPDTPIFEAVEVTIVFNMPRPKGHYDTKGQVKAWATETQHRTKPDLDKLVRGVLDALVIAQVLADDSQVTLLEAHKQYTPAGDLPGAHISITTLPAKDNT